MTGNWLIEYQSIYLFCRTPLPHWKPENTFFSRFDLLRATAGHFSTCEVEKVDRELVENSRFYHFGLHMCVAPQRHAIFLVSAEQLPPRPPLYRAYFSNVRSREPLKKHSDSVLAYSRMCIFFLLAWILYSAFQLSILSEVRLLNFLRLVLYHYCYW